MSEFSAESARASVVWVTPELCTPGGKPVIDVPGESPMSPEITDDPVFVMVVPARTAKLDAVPRLTAAVAAFAAVMPKAPRVTADVRLNTTARACAT